MKLLVKFPTRSRPTIFMPLFERYIYLLSGKVEVEFRITMDLDDKTMNNEERIQWFDSLRENHPAVKINTYYGHSKTKIEAINANMEDAEFDVLLLASDDMVPVVQEYDDVICQHMQDTFPSLMGALHYNDGRTNEGLICLSIMGKALYDYFGYIYHPSYISLYCDNEFHDVVYEKGWVVHIPVVLIQHRWAGQHNRDALLRRNESFYAVDGANYRKRKALGFPK